VCVRVPMHEHCINVNSSTSSNCICGIQTTRQALTGMPRNEGDCMVWRAKTRLNARIRELSGSNSGSTSQARLCSSMIVLPSSDRRSYADGTTRAYDVLDASVVEALWGLPSPVQFVCARSVMAVLRSLYARCLTRRHDDGVYTIVTASAAYADLMMS
jgi:hypothetical protein